MKRLVLFRTGLFNKSKCYFSTSCSRRRNKNEIYNSENRPTPVLDDQVRAQLIQEKPKKLSVIEPSENFNQHVLKTFENCFSSEHSHIIEYLAAANKFVNFLKGRKVPLEGSALSSRHKTIEEKLRKEFADEIVGEENESWLKRKRTLENSVIYKWAPVEYDRKASIIYLLSRSAAEYASLKTIFSEIRRKEPSFQPRTLYDFGSGIGTGLWAMKETFGKVTEAFCVDTSSAMNDIARLILAKGNENAALPAGISFRLHNPKSSNLKYDVVLSSNTLLELPSAVDRLNVIHNLWSRVEPGGCFVLVEMGTNAGFTIISEARDYINQLNELVHNEESGCDIGHILAPCPHESPCPRYTQDSIPCNFPIRYSNFNLQLKGNKVSDLPIHTEQYTYLVVKKGEREAQSWPRLVEKPVKTKGNIYCRLCTPEGSLQEVMCQKKTDSDLFHHARKLGCGQELPVHLDWTPKPRMGAPWLNKKGQGGAGKEEEEVAESSPNVNSVNNKI